MKTNAFIISLCLLVSHAMAEKELTRDYTMIDRNNGLTPTLLSVGSTSFTFSVEWALDLEIPDNRFSLMGMFELDGWWDSLGNLDVDPTKGKAVFEVPYRHLAWNSFEDSRAKLAKKAFFSVVVLDPNHTGIEWILEEIEKEKKQKEEEEKMLKIEEEKKKKEEAEQMQKIEEAQKKKEDAEQMPSVKDEQSREVASSPNRLWLYLAGLPVILALLYLVRRKR